jgi:Ca2+/Na+ antiporter
MITRRDRLLTQVLLFSALGGFYWLTTLVGPTVDPSEPLHVPEPPASFEVHMRRLMSAESIDEGADQCTNYCPPYGGSLTLVGMIAGQCDCKPPVIVDGSKQCYDKKKGVTCCGQMDSYAGVAFYFLVTLYTFLALAIICDDYFCESLEVISERLGLSDDVAGATFMAVGSSAPELFTAIVTTLITGGSEGIGTICGSAVFNIMVIVGVTGLCAGQSLDIWWYPVTRDTVVYIISIVMLYGILIDGQVSLVESLILCFSYGGYVLLMIKNSVIVGWVRKWESRKNGGQQRWEAVGSSAEETASINGDGDGGAGGRAGAGGEQGGDEFSYANPLKKAQNRAGFDAGVVARREDERGKFYLRSMRNPALVIIAKLKFLRLSKSYQARKQDVRTAHNELPEEEDEFDGIGKKNHLEKRQVCRSRGAEEQTP